MPAPGYFARFARRAPKSTISIAYTGGAWRGLVVVDGSMKDTFVAVLLEVLASYRMK